ncbi:MAG TPA: DUF2182 domain-containing protein [Chloroflexota bacterium]|nr:DUF2182 domain-containing protein [Chloroflexota bacterium]
MASIFRTQRGSQQVIAAALLLALAGLAWAAMYEIMRLPAAHGLRSAMVHEPPPGLLAPAAFDRSLAQAGLFLVSWLLMTAAMMLPTSLPMIDTFGQLARHKPGASSRVTLFALSYLAVWAAFGLAAYVFDVQVHAAVARSRVLASHTALLSAAALLLAGAYQFTPLKHRCLTLCRAPLSFLMAHWRDGLRGAFSMGFRHGLTCVGCCWALMFLMFALGMAQLSWMLGLALLMFVEKVVCRGELAGSAAGVLFLGWGAVSLLHALQLI